ncbi:MAG: GNAT family N-acetyltransferase [Anaerolineae bacterium]|nr:GNAT family N-acetyltransferase [Anaerolineae bacterium]
MSEIEVRDLSEEGIDDLCRLCVSAADWDDPAFVAGRELKRRWAVGMLQRWGGCAKLAYVGPVPAGLIQYEPVPEERIVRIRCIFVPQREYWRKGIATRLLSALVEEAKRPKEWFGDRPAAALVTYAFPGEGPGQYPARSFFVRMGFRQVGEDPNLLYAPLEQGFTYRPVERGASGYVPQAEDQERAVLIYGPSFCPLPYVFLKRAEQAIHEVAPGLPVRWIDRSEEPEEANKRGGFDGCAVCGRPIGPFVLDREVIRREVEEALHAH